MKAGADRGPFKGSLVILSLAGTVPCAPTGRLTCESLDCVEDEERGWI